MEQPSAQPAVIVRFAHERPGEISTPGDILPDIVRTESHDTYSTCVSDVSAVTQGRNQPLFEDAVLAMFQSTPDGRVIAVNSAFAQMFGCTSPAEAMACIQDIGQDLFIHPEQSQEIARLVLSQRIERGFDVPCRRKDGTLCMGNLHMWAVKDHEGRVSWLEGCIEDITERKALEDQLLYLCMHDALTGLYNRWYFEQEMERLGRGRQFPISVLVADIDDLKSVNDREGHFAGDQQLRQAARVLQEGCRADDIVARTGGDEFAALLPKTDALTVDGIVRRLRQALTSGKDKRTGSTLGLAIGVATAESGGRLIDVFRQADLRMYQDKARRGQARQP